MSNSKVVYVDTSALGALLIEKAETSDLLKWLDATENSLISSDLLETELRRVAVREDIDQTSVTKILDGITLVSLDRAVYRNAGFLPMKYLRALDALHLEVAIRLNAEAILTYDHRLAGACKELGLEVVSPGN
ncbi:MAG: type II toxin-antitoxin system VapC family toxin [Microbacteriaceae bacterium]|nr:type II toxin-antitoxin system VapC family toxin [Microbacteriaceae bacterium]